MAVPLRFNWVVNEPNQLLVTPPSVTVPLAPKPIAVTLALINVRINGEPAATEHTGFKADRAQLVFADPGPSPVSTKSSVVPWNVMKLSTDPPPEVRFLMLPGSPGPNVPPE